MSSLLLLCHMIQQYGWSMQVLQVASHYRKAVKLTVNLNPLKSTSLPLQSGQSGEQDNRWNSWDRWKVSGHWGFCVAHSPDEKTKFTLASVDCPHACRAFMTILLKTPGKQQIYLVNPFPVVSPFEFLHIQGSVRPRIQPGVPAHVVCLCRALCHTYLTVHPHILPGWVMSGVGFDRGFGLILQITR